MTRRLLIGISVLGLMLAAAGVSTAEAGGYRYRNHRSGGYVRFSYVAPRPIYVAPAYVAPYDYGYYDGYNTGYSPYYGYNDYGYDNYRYSNYGYSPYYYRSARPYRYGYSRYAYRPRYRPRFSVHIGF